MWLVLREGTFLVVAGAILGAAGAFAVARALSALDPDLAQILSTCVGEQVLLVGAPMLFVATVLLACAVPAWRAVRIDPASALQGRVTPRRADRETQWTAQTDEARGTFDRAAYRPSQNARTASSIVTPAAMNASSSNDGES